MKRHLLLLISLLSVCCQGQTNMESISDSIAKVSRQKANLVLASFDTIKSSKVLYSIEDRHYYIIIDDKSSNFNQYYILTNSEGQIIKIKLLQIDQEEHKLLLNINPFKLSQYHKNLITSVEKSKYVEGKLSYFVVKDLNKNSFGEFSLYTLTLPTPINPKLYGYLSRRLALEMQ
jgi:hypothetical protein